MRKSDKKKVRYDLLGGLDDAPRQKHGERSVRLVPEIVVKRIKEALNELEDRWAEDAIRACRGEETTSWEDVKRRLFGNRIGEVRWEKGLTQEQLARKLNISQPAVSKLEQPDHRPRVSTLERVAKVLGVDVVELV